jgi:hypothetical protein
MSRLIAIAKRRNGWIALFLFLSIAVKAANGAVLGAPIPPPGTECLSIVVTENNPVIATLRGTSAVFQNQILLMTDDQGNPCDDGNLNNDRHLFINFDPEGTQADLGTFPIGTKLTFRDCVKQGCEWIVYSGCAQTNPDGDCHARVQAEWMPNEALVGFEDLLDGPFGFNDCSFSLTNTTAGEVTCPEACQPVSAEKTSWGEVKAIYR